MNELQIKFASAWEDFTGKKVKHNEQEQKALERASDKHGKRTAVGVAHRKVKGEEPGLKQARNKIRIKAGVGAAAVVGAAGYGVHKYREKQREKIVGVYNEIYKNAGENQYLDKIASLLDTAGKAITQGVKAIGRGIGGVKSIGQQAMGGHMEDFAKTVNPGKKFQQTFAGAKNAPEQLKTLVGGVKKPTGKLKKGSSESKEYFKQRGEVRQNFNKLRKQQTGARIAIGGVGAAGIYGYHQGTKDATPQY